MRIFLLCCLVLISSMSYAREIAGVRVDESLEAADGTMLSLNGAGIRSKFFIDVYIAELYLAHPAKSAEEVIASTGPKRLIMHFLYDEVTKEKLVAAWNEGFNDNLSVEQLTAMKERIDDFNGLFSTVKKDDVIVLDYIPGQGTVVMIAGQEMGVIAGKDFNDGLLQIWLGKKPVNKSLKEKLLGAVQ